METSLHRELKERFGPRCGGESEVSVGGYRVDAVGPDGCLIEVQSAALGPLRGKLAALLSGHRMRVVKPVVVARRVVWRARPDGPDLSSRRSPKRGAAMDVFDDLVGLARVFPHPNLSVEVLEVEVDEVRVRRRRRPGFAVADRRLRGLGGSTLLREAADLWRLLPDLPPGPFGARDLAEGLGRPLPFARRVAYCLRLAGAARVVGKDGNRLIYARVARGPRPALAMATPAGGGGLT